MNRTQQQWLKMEQQIKKLKKQNQQLKRLLQLSIHPPPQITKKLSDQSSTKNQPIIINDLKQETQEKNINELKKQWAQWSNRLQASIVSRNNKIRHNTEMQELRRTTFLSGGSFGGDSFFGRKDLGNSRGKNNSEQFIDLQLKSPGKSEVVDEKLSLIQDIFLFGPNIQDIENSSDRKFIATHQLYFPQYQKDNFEVYGNYLFPNQLQVKHIRQKNHAIQVNKMIFKNNKKLDCNIFIFQGQQNNAKLQKQNSIINKVNPSKWLYALSIQFSDFISVKNQNIIVSKMNKTVSLTNQITQKQDRYVQGDIALMKEFKEPIGITTSKKRIQTQEQIFKSNFCLCIMTYFPFIRFLKDILIQVFDTVKLRRINKHNQSITYKQIDIKYFIEQLKKQFSTYLDERLRMMPEINQVYEFNYNEIPMKLDLKENNLINEMVSEWAFKIFKLMDKQSALDIFCYIMMQQSICFLSQDRNILTFIILLYVIIFTLPFGYPHPCVSIVFNDQLLQTPFTAVLGINKPTKWLQQNIQHLTQNKQNKLIVNLNEQQIKIKYKKKPRTHKSQKLKKIFYSFYRKIQSPGLFKKKQIINRQTTKQQNDHVFNFFTQLQLYYQQEITNLLPNKQIIEIIKQGFRNTMSSNQDNSSLMYNLIVQKIQKYLGENRKNKTNKEFKQKDSFIQEIIKKQIFKVYIDRIYETL